jgi:hypothetical protein
VLVTLAAGRTLGSAKVKLVPGRTVGARVKLSARARKRL